jgi:enamine deaminase RidA (YjgF/YER057c/UK114 family)
MNIEARLDKLGIVLPTATNPAANYTNCKKAGQLIFVAGKGPLADDGVIPNGKLGKEYTEQDGYRFARSTGLDILAALKLYTGDLDKISGVLKLQGFVNSTAEFENHHLVMNGCSDLMVEVFGEDGVHTRSVLGACSLRSNLPVIIDSIFFTSTS